MNVRKALFFWVLCFGISAALVHAESAGPAVKDFSLQISPEWIELPAQFQNVIASYGKKGTLATFYITSRDFEETKTVRDLQWEDLFKPEFASIDIHNQGETVIGGEKARYCLYSLKPGPFKTAMEGKLPAKYINYVLIHQGKLFSVTFKDTQDGFGINYPSFVKALRTLRFETAPSANPGQAAT